jgi:hypothetical protein
VSDDNRAQAKARLLTLALRAAGEAGVSAQAQALLATIVAEAWVDGPRWTARLGVQLLAKRFSCTRHAVQRWAVELERAQLIHRRQGNAGAVTRWTVNSLRGGSAGATPPVRQRSQGVAQAHHARERQRSPDSDIRCDSGLVADRSTRSIDDEPEAQDRASPEPHDALPRFGPLLLEAARQRDGLSRRIARQHASQGNPDALALLEQLGELVAIDDRSP